MIMASIVFRSFNVDHARNCCFETRQHENILEADKMNTLPFILLPLCGSEEYDMEVGQVAKGVVSGPVAHVRYKRNLSNFQKRYSYWAMTRYARN